MIVAQPALDRLAGRRVTVAGANREAAYVDDDGFVAVLTTAPPQLPNGVQVERLPAVGDEVTVRGELWDPTLRITGDPAALGVQILAATRDADLEGAGDGDLAALTRAVERRDPELATAAGALLIGRGPGLTPEGDDLVAGVAAVLLAGGARGSATAGGARGSATAGAANSATGGADASAAGAASSADLVAGLLGVDLRARTTSLSATLLELAARGMGPEPLQALLAGEPGALDRLLRLGHSTGRAYAVGAALALRCNRVVASHG